MGEWEGRKEGRAAGFWQTVTPLTHSLTHPPTHSPAHSLTGSVRFNEHRTKRSRSEANSCQSWKLEGIVTVYVSVFMFYNTASTQNVFENVVVYPETFFAMQCTSLLPASACCMHGLTRYSVTVHIWSLRCYIIIIHPTYHCSLTCIPTVYPSSKSLQPLKIVLSVYW